jgi:DNA polymerase
MILWLDTETYSECDLKVHGTPRYAEHPSTEIMVAQWAVDDGDPEVADCTPRKPPPSGLLALLLDPDVIIAAHNAYFDRTILRHCWGLDIPVERWYCTMVQAMAHGLPGALGKLGPVMNLPVDDHKDKRGRDLINLFCKPRPKNMQLRRATSATHPQEWAEFLEYSRQDVPAMRAVSRALPTWNYAFQGAPGRPAGHRERKLWCLDQKINDRGFAVDADLARAAVSATKTEQDRLAADMRSATDGLVDGPSRRDKLLAYILEEHGVSLPDMRADTLLRRAEDPDLPDAARLLIDIRLESTKTSTAKYKALLNATSADGRLRNTLQFDGAQRTKRWAGRVFQPQNMPRPTLPGWMIERGIQLLKDGALHAAVPVAVDSVMDLVSNAVRGCIVAAPGRKLCVADLSNIEGRGLVYLAGEEWKLDAFRRFDAGRGPDLYVAAYARAFGVDPSTVTKAQRQIGKVQELALGYQGGVAAFLTFAAVYRMDIDKLAEAVWAAAPAPALADAQGWWTWAVGKKRTLGLEERAYVACQVLVSSWREAHPAVVRLWADAESAVRSAVSTPGVPFDIGRRLKAQRDGNWLRIRLPSGGYLCYLHPRVDDDGQISYMGVNNYTRQWARIKTYGGKLVENATQAFARDVLASNMPDIDGAGYPIVLTVHDELLTEPEDKPEFNSQALASMMSQVPDWAPGLPLAAAGFDTYRYRKDE